MVKGLFKAGRFEADENGNTTKAGMIGTEHTLVTPAIRSSKVMVLIALARAKGNLKQHQ